MSQVHPGELVMVNIAGRDLDDEQARFLREHRIRAVVLFRENLGTEAEVRSLTRRLHEVLGPRALIGIDQEGGAVVRATFLPQAPSAMALGAAGDEVRARHVGAAVARGLRSLGFNWNFAPVLDVNDNPANPVIGERSFGADPARVARLAGAWMDGALAEKVACCVKHFPGHGDTQVDSHLDLPVVDKPRAALEAVELAPFHALRERAPAMMTAHILYPALDRAHPATLSHAILGDVLRAQWRYDGVVITDSLVMQAIHQRYGHARAAVLALQAGADMVMALGTRADQQAAVDAIAAALSEGSVAPAAADAARNRLDRLAARFPVTLDDYSPAARDTDARLMDEAWAAGLTAIRGATPPPRGRAIRVVTQRAVPSDGISEAGVPGEDVVALFAGGAPVEPVLVDDLRSLDWARVPRDERTTVLVSNVHARYGDAARAWAPDLHVALWNPFHALDVAAPTIITYGYAQGAQRALRAWVEGRAPAPGRAPVPLTGSEQGQNGV